MNDKADSAAKAVLQSFVDRCGAYRQYVVAYHQRETDARRLASLHAAMAFRAVAHSQPANTSDFVPLEEIAFSLDHPVQLELPEGDCNFCHSGYITKLCDYFREVQWSPSSGNGLLRDTSWVELFVLSTRGLGVLPPIWTGTKWALFGEDDVATVCNIEFLPLFRVWRKAVSVIGVRELFSDQLVARCSSCVELGFAFRAAGVLGHFSHPNSTSSEVCYLARGATSLGSVRVPLL